MSPRISVLFTCYNHIRYLPTAFQSILDQTYKDFEIIALDDGSTDGTREWLQAQSDPRLKQVFNDKNLGTYGTLNVGIGMAKGEYVAIFNDDDLWLPGKLQAQLDLFETDPTIGLVHTGGYFIGEDDERLTDPKPLRFKFPNMPTGERFVDEIYYNQIITSSALVSKSAIEKVGPFEPSFFGCGDWHLWLRISRFYKVGQVPEELTLYRVHESNASRNANRMNDDDYRIRQWIAQLEPEFDGHLTSELQGAFGHNWACLGIHRGWRGDMKEAREAYRQSLRRSPARARSYGRWLSTFLPKALFKKLR